MTVDRAVGDSGFGPYTVLDLHDLHDLSEDGKGFELEDGWLVEVGAGTYRADPAVGSGSMFDAVLQGDSDVRLSFDPEQLIEF
ncbi:hypothetical protein [Nocardia sp. NPDC058633]|uniref:hypothetical protein n=1 Tax=Nocardia sp. NPDC058633 TaxID=3346568 RepID=UPI00365EE04B